MECKFLPAMSSYQWNQNTDYHRVVLMNYREDGTTPYVVVWKHGLKAMKV